MTLHLPSVESIKKAFSFLCEDYSYQIEYCIDYNFMGTVSVLYTSKTEPNIKIEMERYIVNASILINNRYINIKMLAKFLIPKQILRAWSFYSKWNNFFKYFGNDYHSYIDLIFSNLGSISLTDYDDFYNKYPFEIWKWIE